MFETAHHGFLPFSFYLFTCAFRPGDERSPPTIERTCGFDAKIYKIVDGFFDVTYCWIGNKKNFRIFDFCSALPSLLVAQWQLENDSCVAG